VIAAVLVAEGARAATGVAAEDAAEVERILEADLGGDLLDRARKDQEQLAGELDHLLLAPLEDRPAQRLGEEMGEA